MNFPPSLSTLTRCGPCTRSLIGNQGSKWIYIHDYLSIPTLCLLNLPSMPFIQTFGALQSPIRHNAHGIESQPSSGFTLLVNAPLVALNNSTLEVANLISSSVSLAPRGPPQPSRILHLPAYPHCRVPFSLPHNPGRSPTFSPAISISVLS